MGLVPKYIKNPMTTPKWSRRADFQSAKQIEDAKKRANTPPTSWMGAMARGIAIKKLEQAGIKWN